MKRLEADYSAAYKVAVENNREAITKLASLTDDALSELDIDARKAKRRAFANEILRTGKLRDEIATEIARTGETAAKIIQGELTGIYALNYDFTTYNINKQAGLELTWTVYDRNQLAVLVQEKQSPFTKIAYKRMGQDKIIVRRLQNQLMQGVLNGENQQQLIRRIKTVTGQSISQAKRVAQTERNRVQSQGRDMGISEAQKMGIEMQKQWIARMVRTRDSHEWTHMFIVNAGEKFVNGLEYPGDPSAPAREVCNCFCYIRPMVKSVSPALAKHRAWVKEKSFEDYRREVGEIRARGTSEAYIKERGVPEPYIVGKKTSNGITVSGVSSHMIDRTVQRKVEYKDIENALLNPLAIDKIKVDSQGRSSQRFIGEKSTVIINPDDGNLISDWKTGSRTLKKLAREGKHEN